MTTFTREQLIARANHMLCVGKAFLAEHPEYDGMAKDVELFGIALAAMQQEPVAYMTYKGYLLHAGDPKLAEYSEPTPLYDSPPAPVVPDEKLSREIFEKWCVVNIERNKWHPEVYAHLPAREQWDAWEACRAAMLHGSQPVSNHDELPLDYLQGHKDGLEWAAQLAEANHPQTADWLYDDPIELAKAIRKGPDMPAVEAGNSPVIPDGWISCSERMPDKGQRVLVFVDFDSSAVTPLAKDAEYTGSTFRIGPNTVNTTGEPRVTHWMPLPAGPDFREISNSSTKHFRENAETSTSCPRCGGRGTYHCPQMLGTVECECTLPAAPQQEVK